ncbi:hypothetical protein J7384_05655 [Endozoicomonas sp. G2_1]|uniref:hypothetical protein n=1 Tax=Endozoicomonas sp. G2_1 TaxID=2821091 RepID=UPI001ADA2021|nr:hypothetical protein [Endozoicomonas sp. G2_1]MBO9489841.1 hypothetical protein [Endozoicomonas sp. G2_1]
MMVLDSLALYLAAPFVSGVHSQVNPAPRAADKWIKFCYGFGLSLTITTFLCLNLHKAKFDLVVSFFGMPINLVVLILLHVGAIIFIMNFFVTFLKDLDEATSKESILLQNKLKTLVSKELEENFELNHDALEKDKNMHFKLQKGECVKRLHSGIDESFEKKPPTTEKKIWGCLWKCRLAGLIAVSICMLIASSAVLAPQYYVATVIN